MSDRYCRCGSALARDNAGRLCASCRAGHRRDRAPNVPREFWQTDVMVDALASSDVGRVMRAYRWHPFHGERLPQTLVAGWLHMSQAAMSRIESGRRRMTIDEITDIARVLGMPPIAVPWAPQQSGEDVDPLSRRSLIGAGAGAALGLNATTAPAAARQIDPGLVDHWITLMGLLDRHDAMCGPHEVLPAVCRELDVIGEHRQIARGALRTGLLRVEARWAEFASWLGRDAGDDRAADYWADRAFGLAREAEYQDMVACILLRRSQWAVAKLDSRQAIAFAEAAYGMRGTSNQIRALCALRAANGYALANDLAACERSLVAARDALDRAGPAQTPDAVASREATPAYVMLAEARCWLWLHPRKAVTVYDDGLRDWPRDRTRSRGVHQARLALACAAADDPDRAAIEGLTALDIAQATRSDLTMRELKRLDHELAASDLPAVTDFREAFAAL